MSVNFPVVREFSSNGGHRAAISESWGTTVTDSTRILLSHAMSQTTPYCVYWLWTRLEKQRSHFWQATQPPLGTISSPS